MYLLLFLKREAGPEGAPWPPRGISRHCAFCARAWQGPVRTRKPQGPPRAQAAALVWAGVCGWALWAGWCVGGLVCGRRASALRGLSIPARRAHRQLRAASTEQSEPRYHATWSVRPQTSGRARAQPLRSESTAGAAVRLGRPGPAGVGRTRRPLGSTPHVPYRRDLGKGRAHPSVHEASPACTRGPTPPPMRKSWELWQETGPTLTPVQTPSPGLGPASLSGHRLGPAAAASARHQK